MVDGQWMTAERGELYGSVAALKLVLKTLGRDGGWLPSGRKLRRVIIKTDSEYVVRGVTDR